VDSTHAEELLRALSGAGIDIEPGLSDEEFAHIEASLSLEFPPDLRDLLGCGLPAGRKFPDWRRGPADRLRWILAGPSEGIAFDASANHFWLPEWGPRPDDVKHAVALAMSEVAKAPPLVPVYSHRYIPSEPEEEGNPVFSVVQTDIIVYGNDLADYFAEEFHFSRPTWARSSAKKIRFWSAMAARTTTPLD